MVYSRPLPPPTDAEPGSAEKIRVLAARVARGEYLWHPHDNRRPTIADHTPRPRDAPADLERVEIVAGDGRRLGGYRA